MCNVYNHEEPSPELPDEMCWEWEIVERPKSQGYEVTIDAIFDSFELAQSVSREIEDLINKRNGDFGSTTIEPI